jgi:hypothetical protein
MKKGLPRSDAPRVLDETRQRLILDELQLQQERLLARLQNTTPPNRTLAATSTAPAARTARRRETHGATSSLSYHGLASLCHHADRPGASTTHSSSAAPSQAHPPADHERRESSF